MDTQGINEISEVSSDDLLDNDKWDYDIPIGKGNKGGLKSTIGNNSNKRP